jgi:hypothetical protein
VASSVTGASKPLRARKCLSCRTRFVPILPKQVVCSEGCAIQHARAERAKQERANDRKRLDAMKPMRKVMQEAQASFNAYILARDAKQGCICCGKPFEEQRHGGSVDAGHFLSRAEAPQLRFDESNVFAQRKNCNRPGGATRAAFRAGVIERVGLEEVLRLERTPAGKTWTREELLAIKATYSAKRRELVKGATC